MPVTRTDAECGKGLTGETYESFGFGQENLPQLQDHPAQWHRSRDLHGSAPQATPRLIAHKF